MKPAIIFLLMLALAQLACTVPGLVAVGTQEPTGTPEPPVTPSRTDTPNPTETPEPTATRELPTPPPVAGPLANPVLAPLHANLWAAVREDLGAYLATIHPDSPGYAAAERSMQQTFDTYDLSYALGNVVLLSVEDDEARVSFVLTTRKVAGPEFRDNEITGVYVLRKDGDEWKIYDQEIVNISYLP